MARRYVRYVRNTYVFHTARDMQGVLADARSDLAHMQSRRGEGVFLFGSEVFGAEADQVFTWRVAHAVSRIAVLRLMLRQRIALEAMAGFRRR